MRKSHATGLLAARATRPDTLPAWPQSPGRTAPVGGSDRDERVDGPRARLRRRRPSRSATSRSGASDLTVGGMSGRRGRGMSDLTVEGAWHGRPHGRGHGDLAVVGGGLTAGGSGLAAERGGGATLRPGTAGTYTSTEELCCSTALVALCAGSMLMMLTSGTRTSVSRMFV